MAYSPDGHGAVGGPAERAFRIELIGYRRTNGFIRRLHAGAAQPGHRAPALLRYVEAVNIQQAVGWRLNRELLHWTRRLIDVARGDDSTPPADLRDWVLANLYRPAQSGQRKRIERPGEFLDSPLARPVIDALSLSDPDAEPVTFHLPWKADYRGRIYAETPWLTPQGGDLQRALLELAHGRVLNETGVRALRCHGANLVKRSRLLADLGIAERQVASLAEREHWVVANEEKILGSADAPLAEPFWREVAGEPMQFLAFCLAYRQWRQSPAAPVHLAVQIDGTCNGLQHIAAMTGDAELARAVNVLPREDDLPGDIYSELADDAAEQLGQLAVARGYAVHRYGLELADAWLAAAPARRAWLSRQTAKKVVMTIPYGASLTAQARHVLEQLQSQQVAWLAEAPPQCELDALVAWKNDKKPRRLFVAKCARGLFAAQRRMAYAGGEELVAAVAKSAWEQQRTWAAYVALALALHLRMALARRHPSVSAFADWLGETAKACVGLPLVWQSPLGFPVCQDKFKLRGSSVSARIGSREVRIDVQRLGEDVDQVKQRDALLPNLIHSLDATHLALTLLEAQGHGIQDIGTIHDCLLCHANDADALSRLVRATFARLYAPGRLGLPDPLIRWRDWMALLVRLRAVPRAGEVLAALTYPLAQAEMDLEHDARHGREDAQQALDLLAAIRRRASSERFLLRMLLEHASLGPTPAEPEVMPEPPCAGGLDLEGGAAMSRYFFS